MKKEIIIKRLTLGTIFKFCLTSFYFILAPFIMVEGILEAIGVIPVLTPRGSVTGASEIMTASIFLALALPLSLTFFFTMLLGVGHWIYSQFFKLTIRFYIEIPK